ncbi:YgaP family membrane protein [Solirubrum puertoriconensis]|uniref:Inner membrane protein YgaP-like transmembrane domain-containing protein n=1 Tax=Solirubrum puertoriconensis TaxID=1751427 RepID=A0A9X0HNT6_SOLP1|nr:DUF2892 domain-containing protein [Solirubrum puertoriconensis]KUG09461.1 hypothetical protein ASU33_17195 [Solirubrum puertoriconensis]
MRRNLGLPDRLIRLLFAVMLGTELFMEGQSESMLALLAVLSAGLFFTGLTGFSPLYALLGLSTRDLLRSKPHKPGRLSA